MSVRQIGTLVRLDNNAGYPGKEGSLAAFDRSWYKPESAEKLGQQTRLFASPRIRVGTGFGKVAPRGRRQPQITEQEVT